MIAPPKPLACIAACLGTGMPKPLEPADWAAALRLANDHLVGPAVHAACAAAGGLGRLPEEVAEYLALLHRLNHRRNQALGRQALAVIAELNARGIEPMLLKGTLVLLQDLYPDPAARMIRDIDLLVPKAAVATAADALANLGYGLVNRYPAGHHAYGEFAREGLPGAVDLHVELIDQDYVLPAAEVWTRAEPLALPGASAFAPSPEHALLHTLLHAQVHHLGDFYRGLLRLRPLQDFALQAAAGRDAVDWAAVCRRMDRHRLRTPLESWLLAASRLLGTPWPLPRRPSPAAELHYRRCLAQLRFKAPEVLSGVWGNLRGAFAWHRMQALYGDSGRVGGPLQWRAEHAWRCLGRHDMQRLVSRLLRDM